MILYKLWKDDYLIMEVSHIFCFLNQLYNFYCQTPLCRNGTLLGKVTIHIVYYA